MHTVGAFEAKNTFGSLLDRAEAGEQILITRHGKPVARLVPSGGAIRVTPEEHAAAVAALERMDQRADNLKLGPFDWEEWKSYRDEGRR
jgi:prevent-host-death family protein